MNYFQHHSKSYYITKNQMKEEEEEEARKAKMDNVQSTSSSTYDGHSQIFSLTQETITHHK